MSKFKTGHEKVGGRRKNTPNKKNFELVETCKDIGIDPFKELLILCKSETPIQIRFAALKEVCGYIYPRRKPSDFESSDITSLAEMERFRAMSKSEQLEILKTATKDLEDEILSKSQGA